MLIGSTDALGEALGEDEVVETTELVALNDAANEGVGDVTGAGNTGSGEIDATTVDGIMVLNVAIAAGNEASGEAEALTVAAAMVEGITVTSATVEEVSVGSADAEGDAEAEAEADGEAETEAEAEGEAETTVGFLVKTR